MRNFMIALAMLVPGMAGLLTPATGLAQDNGAAEPSCQGGPYEDFAFWVGDWIVYDAMDNEVGRNTVTREESGCLIVERWTSARGTTGQSYNFYDPSIEQWRQIWVSGGIIIDYAGNLNAQGQMLMEGSVTYRATGRVTDFRGSWTRQGDGSVRQEFREYDESVNAWTDWFTGIYVPAATGSDRTASAQ